MAGRVFQNIMKNGNDNSVESDSSESYPGIDLQRAICLLQGNTDLLVSLYSQFIINSAFP
jgi:hypothetical protein